MANRFTPSNQQRLTNVAVVRIKKGGKRFEIACYKNKVMSWRNKLEKDIDEVLQTHNVFVNVSKGQVAKREELIASFNTDNVDEICLLILEKGELQVSEKERSSQLESSFKEVATLIASMCVDPQSKRPYPVTMIEKGLKNMHFAVKPNRTSKQLALEAIPILREQMPLERARMRIRVVLPAHAAKNAKDKLLPLFQTVESENWDQGSLEVVGLIDPGVYREVDDLVKTEGRKKGVFELIDLKDIKDHEEQL